MKTSNFFQAKFTKSLLGFVVVATAIGTASSAQAYTIYFGEDLNSAGSTRLPSTPNADAARNDFLSNLIGVGTETFESFAGNSTPPLNITFPGAGTATLQGVGTVREQVSGSVSGRYPISGNKFYNVSGNFSFDLTDPVAALGFYGTDIGDFDGQITVTLLDVNGGNQVFNIGNTIDAPNASALYYGIIADNPNQAFTKVTFGNTNSGTDIFGFDDLTIGSIGQVQPPTPTPTGVPEPTTILGLLAFGAVGTTTALKRKSQQKAVA